MSIKKVCVPVLLFGMFLSLVCISPQVFSQISSTKNTVDSASYEAKKQSIQEQIDKVKENLDKLSQDIEITPQKNKLSLQSQSIQQEIDQIDKMIISTRIVIGQLDLETKQKQDKIDALNKEVRQILKELQKKQLESPIQSLLSSKNLGQVLSKMYTLSSLESKADTLRKQWQEENDRLNDNKKQQEQIEDQLTKSRALIKSRESSLTALMEQTNGKESNYQNLLATLQEQKKQLDSQLEGVQGDYISHIAELEGNEEEEYDTTNYTAQCSFEESVPLRVAKGYFGKPADAYMTQTFHCGHDGVDVSNAMGTALYAVADGQVERIPPKNDGCVGLKCNGGFGNYILLKHILPSGDIVYSMVAHMRNQSTLAVGEQVRKGDVIGYMGCTGYTKPYPCGVHTHFVMFSQSYEKYGLGCRLGKAKCYNPTKYIDL